MTGFLSHLVQRTLAKSPAMMPRLSGPYEGLRQDVVPSVGEGGQDATATLRFVRGHAGPQAESSAAPVTGISREEFAIGRPGQAESADRTHVAKTMSAYAEDPVALDLHNVQLPSHPRHDIAAPESAQSNPASAPAVASGWPPEVPPMQPPTLRRAPPTATQVDACNLLDEGESPQHLAIESIGVPRFEPMGRRSDPNTQDSAHQSSAVPSVDPLLAIQIDRPKRGILIEPPAPRTSPPPHASGDAQSPTLSELNRTPTVHVTIGRIELRAVAPAAAPSSPAANRPRLSLSDYLEQRTKAGAR